MKKDEQTIIEAEEKSLTIQEPQDLEKPLNDTKFAHEAAKMLMDIVAKNGWAKKLGGDKPHLSYESWQTVGKYYGYSVKTKDAEYVEYGNTWGFKAKATVVNEITGIEVGGAEAYCMNDEGNWRSKPKFQLASMAQTRAGSKALRQILGFVVALAGYNTTPSEEIEGTALQTRTPEPKQPVLITQQQKLEIIKLLPLKGKTMADLDNAVSVFHVESYKELTASQAQVLIQKMQSLPDADEAKKKMTTDEDIIDLDEVSNGIEQARMIH